MFRSIFLVLTLVSLAACNDTEQSQPSKATNQASEVAPKESPNKESATESKEQDIPDGTYTFSHRFAEHPNMQSIAVEVAVKNGHITLTNNDKADIFPKGVIAEGQLFWHAKSGDWIIVTSEEDKDAEHVGGCSDGPEVVDFKNLIYWTC